MEMDGGPLAGIPQHGVLAYVFKAVLQETKSPVWRRIVVPQGATFFQLHEVLQDAFGWHRTKQHEFAIRPGNWSSEIIVVGDPACAVEGYPVLPEKRIVLSDYYEKTGSLTYTYDQGAGWKVRVMKERTEAIDGAACPKILRSVGRSPRAG